MMQARWNTALLERSMATPEGFWYHTRVQFDHTDAQGRVFYAHYFRLLDQARCAYWETLGFTEDDVRQIEHDTVIVHVEADYLGPAAFYDLLDCRCHGSTWPLQPASGLPCDPCRQRPGNLHRPHGPGTGRPRHRNLPALEPSFPGGSDQVSRPAGAAAVRWPLTHTSPHARRRT